MIPELFNKTGVGVATSRDALTIHYTKEDILRAITTFSQLKPEEARKIFDLGEDVRDWKIELAQKDLLETNLNEHNIIDYLYRPFDKRYTYYTGKTRGFHSMPRKEIMGHLLYPNYAIFVGRQGQAIGESDWNLVFCGNGIEDYNLFRRGNNACIPLYLYEKQEGLFTESSAPIKTENLTKEFRRLLEKNYHTHYTPEQVFGAIYALLYSPSYRKKYAEFLKIDFPRFIFPETQAQFEHLAALGWQLIQVHLFKTIPDYPFGEYQGKGKHNVVAPDYRKNAEYERLYINPTQYFDHIPENVYQFQIGGYQVLEKYLKDRKERILTLTEVKTVRNTVKALAFTIEQMQTIDDATKDWI